MNYWINSNSGDYITENNGQYHLHLLARWVGESGDYKSYLHHEVIEITQAQFSAMKGFLPIKEKKLFSRTSGISKVGKYAPTLSDGTKGKSTRVKLPSIQEVREQRLKELGL